MRPLTLTIYAVGNILSVHFRDKFWELFTIHKCPTKYNVSISEKNCSEKGIFANFGLFKLLMHSKIEPQVKSYVQCLKIQWSSKFKREGNNNSQERSHSCFGTCWIYFPDKHNYLDKKAEAEALMGTAGGIGSHNIIAHYFYLYLCISLLPIPFVL